MKTRAPPRLATWLLENAGRGACAEELVGDLIEQFTNGRSGYWYWRQAIGALLLNLRRAVLTHATSFIAALLAGYAIRSAWLLGHWRLFPASDETLAVVLGRPISIAALLFASGWIVTRMHRSHQRAVSVAFAAVIVAPRIPDDAQLIIQVLRDLQPPGTLIPQLMPSALQVVFTLVGGLWVIRMRRFAKMERRTRWVAALTITLTFGNSMWYEAWRAGVLEYSAAARYPIDVAEIACGAYLALLLWRRESPVARSRTLNGGVTA